MIVAIAADHAGRPLLDRVAQEITAAGHEPLEVGPALGDPADDYPDIAQAVGGPIGV